MIRRWLQDGGFWLRGYGALLGGLLLVLVSSPLIATHPARWQVQTRHAASPGGRAQNHASHKGSTDSRPIGTDSRQAPVRPRVAAPTPAATAAAPAQVPAAVPTAPAPVPTAPAPSSAPASAPAPSAPVSSSSGAQISAPAPVASARPSVLPARRLPSTKLHLASGTPAPSLLKGPRAVAPVRRHALRRHRPAGLAPLSSAFLAKLVSAHRRCLSALSAQQRETLLLRSGIGAQRPYSAPQVAALWKVGLAQEAQAERGAAGALAAAPAEKACAKAGAVAAHPRHRARRARARAAGQRVHGRRRAAVARAGAGARHKHPRRHRRHPLLGDGWLFLMAPIGSLAAALAAARRRRAARSGSRSLPLA